MFKRLAAITAAAGIGASLLVAGTAATPTGAATKNAISIAMRDYAFVVDGKLRPGQASITVTNPGEEAHILAIFKLKPSIVLKDVKKALNSENEEAFNKVTSDQEGAYGYPFILTPGGEATTVTNLFKAGNYVMICFFADAEGKPHFAHGMIQTMKIAGKPVKPTPVESDGTVEITDDGITAPPSPAPTSVTVKVDNQGTTVHSLVIIKLNGDATVPDVDTFFDSFEGGPYPADAPGEVLSGIGDIPAGKSAYLSWTDLPPGRYGYASVSGGDEQGQDDDLAKGLYGEFTIE